MKKLTTTLAAVIMATSANASSWFDPPAKYRGEPTIPYQVYRLSFKDLQKACFNKHFPIRIMGGCAKQLHGPRRCAIFIADKPIPNFGLSMFFAPLLTPEMALRHEKGHCAGWPNDHRG